VTRTGALPQPRGETGKARWLGWLMPAALLLAVAQRPPDSRSGEPVAAAGPSDAYVKGLYHFSRGSLEWPDAARWLERAVEEDPGSAPARTALAATYVSLAEARLRDPREAFALAERAARAALAIAPASAEARTWAAVARLYGAWDWTTAGRELPRAIALDPHFVASRRAYAAYLAAVGNLGGAVEQIEVARRLDPVCSALRGEAAWYRYCARRYDEAAALCRSSLAVRDDLSGTLAGKATGERNVLELLDRLRASKRFIDVKLLYLRQADRSSRTVAFALTFTYTGKE